MASYSVADLELLPNILQKKYALLRDLDKSLQGAFANCLFFFHRLASRLEIIVPSSLK